MLKLLPLSYVHPLDYSEAHHICIHLISITFIQIKSKLLLLFTVLKSCFCRVLTFQYGMIENGLPENLLVYSCAWQLSSAVSLSIYGTAEHSLLVPRSEARELEATKLQWNVYDQGLPPSVSAFLRQEKCCNKARYFNASNFMDSFLYDKNESWTKTTLLLSLLNIFLY